MIRREMRLRLAGGQRRGRFWRSLAAILIGIGLLLPSAASAQRITISRSGAIGPLRLNVSSAAEVVKQWGQPAYETTGNMFGVSGSALPDYELLGYRCRSPSGYSECAVDFYISKATGRLESFETTTPEFMLFGRVHVGMSADLAARHEHSPNVAGCGQFIRISTRQLSVQINTLGGTGHRHGHGLYVSGGRVASIAIDYKHYGVGVLFC
jgi:hypothetical protein